VVDAVLGELVSVVCMPKYREFTGNFGEFYNFPAVSTLIHHALSMIYV
jgi:hypothetical protein